MQNSGRTLYLDIFDYSGNKLCPLYDNDSNASGQATDVFITTERNGWKELSFTLPSVLVTEHGNEENYRLNFLKADYLIRAIDDKETDWFIISEPKITHNNYSKNVQVTAGHISQLLKLKNLGLEFSDDEGNNIGTARELAETILEGTGWTLGYVYPFAEKDKVTPKYRSLRASAKTGAFKLMASMCELFDAKPIYHGGTRTVDIVPINPFSEPAPGELPDLELADGVLELHYGKNVKNVTRTLNTENIVTKLYAYGAYGDKTHGYCGLDECVHTEHIFTLTSDLEENTTYYFTFADDSASTNEAILYGSQFADWSVGVISAYGADRDNAARLRTSTYLTEKKGTLSVEDGYEYCLYVYRANDSGGYYNGGSVGTSGSFVSDDIDLSAIPEEYDRYRIILRHNDKTTEMTMEDANKITWIKPGVSVSLTYNFICKNHVDSHSKLVYSTLDPSSMMYIWDEENHAAYPVIKGTQGNALPAELTSDSEVKNWFSFVMNFDYYRENGLLTDEMIQVIADYQRQAPIKYEEIVNASAEMSDSQTILSQNIGYIDFCKLAVDRYKYLTDSSYVHLVLDKTEYKDGVTYRSDYDKNKDKRFKWITTDSLDTNGDPINTAAGIVYIVHNTNPVTWDKAYLKALDDERDPSDIELWASSSDINMNDINNDQFFLFSYNGINGRLGTLEANDESAVQSIEKATKVVTVDHPVYFSKDVPSNSLIANVSGYAWAWQYTPNYGRMPSSLYFAYKDNGDTSWNSVYFQESDPSSEEGSYWYNWRTSVLKNRKSSEWVTMNSNSEQRIAALFPTVFMLCMARDRYCQGLSERYKYVVPDGETLQPGNYFFENEYRSYWTFTTNEPLPSGSSLVYDFTTNWVIQTKNNIETTLKPKGYRFDNVYYHPNNILDGKSLESGFIDETGMLQNNDTSSRSQSYISVVPNTVYDITGSFDGKVHFYNDKKNWISCSDLASYFMTPANCTYIRLQIDSTINNAQQSYENAVICARELNRLIVIEDLNYAKLQAIGEGDNIGILSCIKNFADYANLTYDTNYKKLKAAQDAIDALEANMALSVGDLYREGWWQDSNYVDGDEEKLYTDALDNVNHVSKPEATYNIGYLNLYSANRDGFDYAVDESTVSIPWQNVSSMSAIHLVDPDISVNEWAYVDKIQDCYDKPWQTKLTINTNLTTIAQHSFTDVMTNIADVASTMKGKASYYDKTLGTAATEQSVNELSASISKGEKELLSAYSRLDELDGTMIAQSTRLRQTENEIAAEAERAEGEERRIWSQLRITADSIAATVSDEQVDSKVNAAVELAASGLRGEITSAVEEASTTLTNNFQATADGFSTQISQITTDVNNIQQVQQSYVSATPEHIRAVVRDTDEGNEFHTSSVDIDANGVAISTSGSFTVESDNFTVNDAGKLSVNNAYINGDVYSNGKPVLTADNIYVGSMPPVTKKTGMIWIKPGIPATASTDDSGSGSSTTPTETQRATANYSYYNNNSNIYLYQSDFSANLTGNGFSSSLSNNTYTLQIPMRLTSTNNGKTGADVVFTLSGGGYSVSSTVRITEDNKPMKQTFTQIVEFVSANWLGSTNTVMLTVHGDTISSTYKRNVAIAGGTDISLVCEAK